MSAHTSARLSSAQLREMFEYVANTVRSLPPATSPEAAGVALSITEKLTLYSYYQQATKGDIPPQTARPSLFDPVGRQKHDAWTRRAGTPPKHAMFLYVQAVIAFLNKFPDRPVAQGMLAHLKDLGAPTPDMLPSDYIEDTDVIGLVDGKTMDLLLNSPNANFQSLDRETASAFQAKGSFTDDTRSIASTVRPPAPYIGPSSLPPDSPGSLTPSSGCEVPIAAVPPTKSLARAATWIHVFSVWWWARLVKNWAFHMLVSWLLLATVGRRLRHMDHPAYRALVVAVKLALGIDE